MPATSSRLDDLGHHVLLSSLLSPDPPWDQYTFVSGGHVNQRGLDPVVGEAAIKEMMRLGMIIDIDHMSERAANRTLQIAEEFGYPLASGQTGFRPGSENTRTVAQLRALGRLGGMMGIGWAGGTSNASSYATRGGSVRATPPSTHTGSETRPGTTAWMG